MLHFFKSRGHSSSPYQWLGITHPNEVSQRLFSSLFLPVYVCLCVCTCDKLNTGAQLSSYIFSTLVLACLCVKCFAPCVPKRQTGLCESPTMWVSDADRCDIVCVFYCLNSAWNKWIAKGLQSPGLQCVCTCHLSLIQQKLQSFGTINNNWLSSLWLGANVITSATMITPELQQLIDLLFN